MTLESVVLLKQWDMRFMVLHFICMYIELLSMVLVIVDGLKCVFTGYFKMC